MNGTSNEFQADQQGKTVNLTPRRVAQGWTRRINLNPGGVSRLTEKRHGEKRRKLTIGSFSATTFAVGWRHIEEEVRLAAEREHGSELPSRIVLFGQ